jgi:hypothetical protein
VWRRRGEDTHGEFMLNKTPLFKIRFKLFCLSVNVRRAAKADNYFHFLPLFHDEHFRRLTAGTVGLLVFYGGKPMASFTAEYSG